MLEKTIDLGYVQEIHSHITDAKRKRLLTSEGPKNVLLLDTIRRNRRKFLKSWLQDDRFSHWLVCTQFSGGGGLCKTCILMRAHLTHGSLANAAFVKRPCIDFKKFIEKALSHRDVAYHREATLAAKDFISSMESGKDIYACTDAGRAKRTAENKKILTSIVKAVLFCASNNIPLCGHSADKGNFMKLLQFRMDAGNEALNKHFVQMAGNAKYTSPTIQNEILGIASTMVVEEFVAEANESFISVVADEYCNISGIRLLKSKFIVIALKQNRPRNIINVRYFSRTLMVSAALFENVLMITLIFCVALCLVSERPDQHQ